MSSSQNDQPKKVSGFGEPAKYESKFKLVAWFKNYWYYYKAPVLIISILVILAGWFIFDMVTAEEIDMRLYTITEKELSVEAVEPMQTVMSEYATDVDGDGKVILKTSYLRLAASPATEQEQMAYQQILTVMVDDTVTLLLIDDYVYNYLQSSDGLEPLSTYGIEGVDEYRIRATDSELLKATKFSQSGEYYLVFRVMLAGTQDDPLVQARYADAVALAAAVAADTEQVLVKE